MFKYWAWGLLQYFGNNKGPRKTLKRAAVSQHLLLVARESSAIYLGTIRGSLSLSKNLIPVVERKAGHWAVTQVPVAPTEL